MDTHRTTHPKPLAELLRPHVELTLTSDLVTADRCKRIRAGVVVVCRFQERLGGGRDLARVWRKGTAPQDGMTANIDELQLATSPAVPA